MGFYKLESEYSALTGGSSMMEKYFEYKKHKTNFKTEVIAGVTTFLTMAYIMFLNPLFFLANSLEQKKVFLILEQYLLQQ